MNNHIAQFRPRRGRHVRRGFTLVEVMISVALVLVLIYGVAQVFKISGDAVGANQAVSSIVRDHRAAAATMAEDVRNAAADSPLFLISSRIAYNGPAGGTGAAPKEKVDGSDVSKGFAAGFKNAQQQRDNGNDDPTFVDGTQVSFARLGATDRTPRVDRIGFFTRSLYTRQTLPDKSGAPLATSGEAFVWVGHTSSPKPATDTRWQQYPGAYRLQLPENQFASDRIVGRMAILLKDANSVSTTGVTDERPVVGQATAGTPQPLWPFGYDNHPFEAYTDLAPITLDQFRQALDNAFLAPPGKYAGPLEWFRPMEDDLAANKVMRFWCDPKVTYPIKPQILSQSVPYFLGHCTQFIVEYAGDFLKQDENDAAEPGKALDAVSKMDPTKPAVPAEIGQTDGQVDYVIDTSGDLNGATPYDPPRPAQKAKWVRRVRWYGLPRDTDGDGRITINDVVPLADVMEYYGLKNSKGQPVMAEWERPADLPAPGLVATDNGNSYRPWKYDYAHPTKGLQNKDAQNFRYTCAWHNDAPMMIRVLVKIDDPTGKLQDGQWYEYVFSR